jgi:hypothetical protein
MRPPTTAQMFTDPTVLAGTKTLRWQALMCFLIMKKSVDFYLKTISG